MTGSFTPLLTYRTPSVSYLALNFLLYKSSRASLPQWNYPQNERSFWGWTEKGEWTWKEGKVPHLRGHKRSWPVEVDLGTLLLKSLGSSYLIFLLWWPLSSLSVSSVDPENLQHEITLGLSQVLTKLPTSLVVNPHSILSRHGEQHTWEHFSLPPYCQAEGHGR